MVTKIDPRMMAMMMAKKRAMGMGNMPPPKTPMPSMAPPPPMPMGAPPMPMGAPSMKKGGSVKKMAKGGLTAGHKAADGVASKGKTKG
jgi:hypothetical protein